MPESFDLSVQTSGSFLYNSEIQPAIAKILRNVADQLDAGEFCAEILDEKGEKIGGFSLG